MRKPVLSLLALLAAPHLHAQLVEVYGIVTGINANNVPSAFYTPCPVGVTPGQGCGATASFTVSNAQAGFGGGVTLNLLRLPVLKLGLDVRGSRHSGTNGADTALGGVKLTIHPPFLNIRPYLQASAGYLGTTESPSYGPTTSAKYIAAEGLAGLDLPLIPILDLRVIELGAGHALNSVNATKPTFVTASAGLVLHF